MKASKYLRFAGIFSAGAAILFVFGCIASSYQTAETLEPKQVSVGVGLMRAENMDNEEADAIDLLDLGLRYGAARGFDFGLAYTRDISAESEGALSTVWGDLKFQLTNTDNEPQKLQLGLGLIKGYVSDYETHVTSIPLRLSIPIDDHFMPTLQYRLTFLSDGFLPTDFENPRHEVALGLEYSFNNHSDSWNTKIGAAVGLFNSLTGGDGDQGLIMNLGITVESPIHF